MDTKSKSKKGYIVILIVGAYLISLCSLCIVDVIRNKDYLKKEPYFDNKEFKIQLINYTNNIQLLNINYKKYELKADKDKVTLEELLQSKKNYDFSIRQSQNSINDRYDDEILKAQENGDNDKVNQLTDEKNNEMKKLASENTKTIEDFKREIIEYKNKDYEKVKAAVKEKSVIKYFIIKENKVVDTNIQNVSDIDDYIKNNSLYYIKFPEQTEDKIWYQGIEQWLKNYRETAYFIIPKDIPKDNYIYTSYKYCDSIKKRLIKEIIMAIISLVLSIVISVNFERKVRENNSVFLRLERYYSKIPLDLTVLIYIIYTSLICEYTIKTTIFYEPYNIDQLRTLTIIAVYMFYLVFNINILMKYRGELKKQLKKCILYRLFYIKINKKVAITISIIIVALNISSILLSEFNICVIIISIINMVCFMYVVIIYFNRIHKTLHNIIKGTDAIASGDFNNVLEEKGDGELSKLAQNINNMKTGYKKSLENEIKSERLKSELITNVSHDLKTPLTSIINYVNLLKNENLSKEEVKDFIDVLDRKALRLKILIDDLFEASKMASGSVELQMEKVDVNSLLQQALAEMDEKIMSSSLIFKVSVPEEKVYAKLDGRKTWRVFENLINNILKYSQPQTRVYIDMLVEDRNIVITMKNISSYEMDFSKEEIFERFKRGDKSRKTEGSGLGLSIAKSIVELQKGELKVDIDGDLFKASITFPRDINCQEESFI